MVIVSPTTMSPVVNISAAVDLCPNHSIVFNLSSPIFPLHHARYLQAFDPCLLASSRGVPTTPTTPTTPCLRAPCAIPTGCTFPAPVGAPGSTQRNLTRPEQIFRVMQY